MAAAITTWLTVAASAQAASPDVVISQVYGAGGNSGATLDRDYVELFNRGTAPVAVDGWSVQYASAIGTGHFAANVTPVQGTIVPGGRLLVGMTPGTNGAPTPTPDVVGQTAMSASSGKVLVAATATGLACNGSSTPCSPGQLSSVRDLVGYGDASFAERAPAPAASATSAVLRAAGGCTDTDDNAADFSTGAPSPRNSSAPASACDATPPVLTEPCGAPATAVGAIQGTGPQTARAGEVVSVEGVVVGDFQQGGGFGGVYVQGAPDGDDATADGLFVRTGEPLAAGDRVRVRGTVAELATGASRLTSVINPTQVTVCAQDEAVEPVTVALPVERVGDLERFEGMRVRFAQPLTVTETFTLGRFGELRLAAGGRLFTPTNLVAPGPAAQALAADNRRRSLVLDDGSNRQNPDPAPYGLAADRPVRSGDTVGELTGVLDDRFGAHRVQPVGEVAIEPTNPRPAAPAAVGGTLQVAAFNVLNFFNGPSFPTPRGATTPFELERQTAKEVSALVGLDADVVGLMELENDGGDDQAIADLVAAVNERAGAGTYAYVDTGVVGTDAIRVGLLFKPAVVRPVGAPAVLDATVDPRFDDRRSRPAIAQTFELTENLERVTVAVNHLKSKGSACAGDPDAGDGQGNCNGTRLRAAQALADWLAGDPTGAGTTDSLIIGDLNAYAEEDPIRALREAGYVDQVRRFGGAGAYSYVFDGQAGYLDHGLASSSLSPKVAGATDWHINADEPTVFDYNTEFRSPGQVASFYDPGPFRSSDHDPLLLGLDLRPSFADAIALTERFVRKAGVAHALVVKLEAARRARTRGDEAAEADALQSYRDQLAAQAGKSIDPERAALLQHISYQLMGG